MTVGPPSVPGPAVPGEDVLDRAILMDGGAIVAEASPEAILTDERFERVFRVRSGGSGGWALSPAAGPQSSP